MPTYTAYTTLKLKDKAEALGEALERLAPEPVGVGVFEMEDGSGLWEVGGYFTDAPDQAGLALVAAVFDAKPFVVSQLPEVDWVAKVKRDLAPVEAGHYFVYGKHDADKLPADSCGLLIEAAMAFGTGHHGTTLGCLRALDRLRSRNVQLQNVADIGCGTAVLAMAAAKTWTIDAIASDIDPVAVEVAMANVAANGLEQHVKVVQAAGFDHAALGGDATFQLIFANILKGPLISLAPEMAKHTAEGGFAILSGILNVQADEVAEVYARNGYSLEHSEMIGDWSTLTCRKGHVAFDG